MLPSSRISIDICSGLSVAATLDQITLDLQRSCCPRIQEFECARPIDMDKCFSTFSPRTPPSTVFDQAPLSFGPPIVLEKLLDPGLLSDSKSESDASWNLRPEQPSHDTSRNIAPGNFVREVHNRDDIVIVSRGVVLIPEDPPLFSDDITKIENPSGKFLRSDCFCSPLLPSSELHVSGKPPSDMLSCDTSSIACTLGSTVDTGPRQEPPDPLVAASSLAGMSPLIPNVDELNDACPLGSLPESGLCDTLPSALNVMPSHDNAAPLPDVSACLSPFRSLDILRKSLVPVTPKMPLAALRESARVLRSGFKPTTETSDNVLGVALREPNDGNFNNCLYLSLRDIIIPSPERLREMLASHFCTLDEQTKRDLSLSILPFAPARGFDCIDQITNRCTQLTRRGGHLSAQLLLSLLDAAAHDGSLPDILSEPCDIVFFQESSCRTYAVQSISFQYPVEQPSSVIMVMCNSSVTHFERLRPAGDLSEVMTSASPHNRKDKRHRSRSVAFAASDTVILLPERNEHEPVWRSPHETKNPFATLALLAPDTGEETVACTPGRCPQRKIHSASVPLRTQPRHRVQAQPPHLARPECFVPSGARRIKTSSPLSEARPPAANPPVSSHFRRPLGRSLGDFVPPHVQEAASWGPPGRSHSPSLTPCSTSNAASLWPTPSEARNQDLDAVAIPHRPNLTSSRVTILTRPPIASRRVNSH